MWNPKNKANEQTKLINTENRIAVARGWRCWGWTKWVKGIQRWKLPAIK